MVSIDSMIITPRVPTLGEPSADVGIEQATTPDKVLIRPETSAQQIDFDQNSCFGNKLLYLKRATMNTISATVAIEKDFADLALEQTSQFNMEKSILQRIHILESLLECEKTINA